MDRGGIRALDPSSTLNCGELVPVCVWGGGGGAREEQAAHKKMRFISTDRGDYVSIYN
jgi:hypothetical protein